ncbi:MAG: NUDIX hydrolase, partial [Lactobacillus iners]|nr:NUDIX hydrolase [Lactobacillus iners]
MDIREEEISRKRIFSGKLIDLDVETISLPNGKTALREIVN